MGDVATIPLFFEGIAGDVGRFVRLLSKRLTLLAKYRWIDIAPPLGLHVEWGSG